MQRVTRATKVVAKPAVTVGEGAGGFFSGGDPAGGTPATQPGYEWFNRVQEELVNAIEAGGLVLDPDDDTQLAQAIVALIGSGIYPAATQLEMEAGTEAALREMSPVRVKQAISALGGKILQVQQTVYDGNEYLNSYPGSGAVNTSVSVSITPSSINSRILVMGQLITSCGLYGGSAYYDVVAQLKRDSTPIFKGPTPGNRIVGFHGSYDTFKQPSSYEQYVFSLGGFVDSPATVAPTTYKFAAYAAGGVNAGAPTYFYINRSHGDNNYEGVVEGASNIIAMEIGA